MTEQDTMSEFKRSCFVSIAFPILFPYTAGHPTDHSTIRLIRQNDIETFAAKI